MRKLIILIFFVFIQLNLNNSFSNYIPYFNITNEAEWLYDQGKYHQAEELFLKAFKMDVTPKWKDILIYVKILDKKKLKKLIFNVIEKQLIRTRGVNFNISDYLIKEKIELSNKQYLKLDKYRLDTLSEKQLKLNYFNHIIDSLNDIDQLYRMQIPKETVYFEFEHRTVSTSYAIQKTDSLNVVMLKKLFIEHRLADFDVNNYKFQTLLIHLDENFIILKDYLLLMLKNGNLDPYEYASTFDRSIQRIGICSKYFSYTPNLKDISCIDFNSILKNREEIGLSKYYYRPSFTFYISVNKMMKYPLETYFIKFKNE